MVAWGEGRGEAWEEEVEGLFKKCEDRERESERDKDRGNNKRWWKVRATFVLVC